MKDNNTNEELFDGLFREELANASAPPPPGAWEGIASSLGSSTAAAAVSAGLQTAVWLKAAIGLAVLAGVSWAVYLGVGRQTSPVAVPVVSQDNLPTAPSIPDETHASADGQPLSQTPVTVPQKGLGKKQETGLEVSGQPGSLENRSEIPSGKYEEMIPAAPMKETVPVKDERNMVSQGGPVSESEKEEAEAALAESEIPGSTPPVQGSGDSSFIFVPNTFSPGLDGINDTYLIRLINEEYVEIVVYDKSMSEVIFRTRNKYTGWNGHLPNGDLAPPGKYIVKVVYKFRDSAAAKPLYSPLMLFR